ncbi:MAG: hypothetical protein RJB38_1904 [Pseudomonadota bacterium]|jgi:hypothetical protein
MNQRSRLLIYERKEILLLGVLSLLVAIFAFTFGIHLGKRVPPRGKPVGTEPTEVSQVTQLPDQAPTRAEAQDKVAGASRAAGEVLDETLRQEVESVGLKLDHPVAVELPKKTVAEKRSPHRVAPEGGKQGASAEEASNLKPEGEVRKKAEISAAPVQAVFTIQILALPASEEAQLKTLLDQLRKAGLKPWVRKAEIPGKGTWYRIHEGAFSTKDAAEQAGAVLKSEGKVSSYVVTRTTAGEKHAEPAHAKKTGGLSADHGSNAASKASTADEKGSQSSSSASTPSSEGEHHE